MVKASSSSHGGRLDVVLVDVLLQVQDGNLILLRHTQQLAEGRIRVDDLALLQVVGLGIRIEALADVTTADERTLLEAQEGGELIRDGHGRDERLAVVGGGALGGGGALAPTRGLLGEARGQLLDLLGDRAGLGGERLLLVGDLRRAGDGLGQLGGNVLLHNGGSDGGIRDGRRHNGGGRGNGGDHNGGLLGALRLRGGLHNGGRGSNDGRGGGRGGGLGGLRGLGGRAHFAIVRGSNGGHRTQVCLMKRGAYRELQLWGRHPQKLPG